MLFNTFNFVFIFFPLVLSITYFLKKKKNDNLYYFILILVSLYFYSYFLTSYTIILIGSVIFNYYVAKLLNKTKRYNYRLLIFIFVIIVNISVLIYFKYFNFIINNINFLFSISIVNNYIILPLAISFFTFQQIAFLTSIYKKEINDFNLIKYALFICFFPQLIAGPIIRFKEFFPQISNSLKYSLSKQFLIPGLIVFSIGMFKKIIISSYLASIADPVFKNIDNNILINSIDAWIGLLAFSFQIYFDFSGYSDMAIGLALCLGFKLPINFYSPYKSSSIKEFWSNWHITLSRFLKNHIYIPLGGNKNGNYQQKINIFFTMLIGGIWHGASWNFLLWGGYHGLLIILEKFSEKFKAFKNFFFLKRYLVFILITFGWIPFRCQSFSSVEHMLYVMFNFNISDNSIFLNLIILKVLAVFFTFLVIMYLPNTVDIQKKIEKDKNINKYLVYIIVSASVMFLLLAEPNQNINREFIYFQF